MKGEGIIMDNYGWLLMVGRASPVAKRTYTTQCYVSNILADDEFERQFLVFSGCGGCGATSLLNKHGK